MMCEQCSAETFCYQLPISPDSEAWFLIKARQDGDFLEEGEYGIVKLNNPMIAFWFSESDDEKSQFWDFKSSMHFDSNYYSLSKYAELMLDCGWDLTQPKGFEEWLFKRVKECIKSPTDEYHCRYSKKENYGSGMNISNGP